MSYSAFHATRWPPKRRESLATYGCESWTLRKNEETRLDAFEMKGLRKILRVSWTAKKTRGKVYSLESTDPRESKIRAHLRP